MAWQMRRRHPWVGLPEYGSAAQALEVNQQCFIRKAHRCDKMFGASKSCFIACPTADDLEPILGLMSEKLSKAGVEAIIAVKERAYGQDIFCTKICGKIIEARFCIVILDDTPYADRSVPNPNVYYEYGLMTSLRKHIIPLQKDDLKLAFNIQSYDTIKYNSRNISAELDRAIKDAMKLTEVRKAEDQRIEMPEKRMLRKLELAGFELKDREWFLSSVVDDTGFVGFGHRDGSCYLYLAKIDEKSEFQELLDDTGVVLYRTEKIAQALEESLKTNRESREKLEERIARNAVPHVTASMELRRLDEAIAKDDRKYRSMSTIYVGFIVSPHVDSEDFLHKAQSLCDQSERYRLAKNVGTNIVFGDITISLGASQSESVRRVSEGR